MRSNSNIGFRDNSSSPVIYHSTKVPWYVWLLLVTKFFRCIGVFVAFDAVRSIHVVYFLLLVTLISAIVYGFVQRPLSSNKKLQQAVWVNIARHACVQTCLNLLWLYGLSQVGPLRAVLLIEHADIVVLAVWGAVLKGIGGPGRLRGSFWFVLGVLSLVLFDNDAVKTTEHPEGQQHHGVKHLLYYLLAWTGLSDHEGGIVVLLLTLCLQAYVNNGGRRLAVDVVGSKRLQALTAIASTIFLIPLSLIVWLTQETPSPSLWKFVPQAFVVALFVFVLHSYVEAACTQRLDVVKTARIGTLGMFCAALLLNAVWRPSAVPGDELERELEHAFSGGVVFTIIMLAAATLQLTSNKGAPGSNMLPLHGLQAGAIQRSQSLITLFTSTLKLILANRNSRTIFYFLCVNLCFTFVELAYGVWTNSLGLISDGFHMLFDCSALVMGLVASVMATWKPTKTFPFGYGRIEVLSGFVNGLFLTVIGLMVFYEAVGRLFEPPEIHTERLLAVAVCGLIINVFGMVSFSHTHSHGHSHDGGSHSHRRSGPHSHRSNNSHGHNHSHNVNANMQGVFLHIMADTLGSVAVIVSSLLIDWYGWLVADPICSLMLAALILASVLPLLKESASILILRVPVGAEENIKKCIDKILEMEHVVSCKDPRFWHHAADVLVATVTVQCKSEASEQRIIHSVTNILQEAGFSQVSVEVEMLAGGAVTASQPSQWGLGVLVNTQSNPFPNSIRAV